MSEPVKTPYDEPIADLQGRQISEGERTQLGVLLALQTGFLCAKKEDEGLRGAAQKLLWDIKHGNTTELSCRALRAALKGPAVTPRRHR